MKLILPIFLFLVTLTLSATLEISNVTTESTGDKALVTLTVKNNFTQPIRAAKAWVVLMDGEGKMVGQKAQWISSLDLNLKIDSDNQGKSLINLPQGKTVESSIVVDTKGKVSETKLTFSRIILKDGTMPDVRKSLVASSDK